MSFEVAQQTNKLLAHSSIEEQVHYATSTTPDRPISKSCFFCGSKTPHTRKKCPARGQTCNYCHKLSHFSSVCQQAARDQRSPRPPRKQPIRPNPKREHVRMIDQDESSAIPSKGRILYEHCFTISDTGHKTSHSSCIFTSS